ncbi:MAG: hypothetical protein L3J17_01355 [Candidatus Jettenia sp.]|nr:MAG: hypothetical protein L3J17_01355 [Candidatus Jettenia sp.]
MVDSLRLIHHWILDMNVDFSDSLLGLPGKVLKAITLMIKRLGIWAYWQG